MKQIIATTLLSLLILISSCNGQSKAMEDQKKAYEIMAKNKPKNSAPSDKIYMRCSIDGKSWSATELIPDPETGSSLYHLVGKTDDITIAFYVPGNRRYLLPGYTRKFGDGHNADFEKSNDDQVFYGGDKGTYAITKVDDDGFEGTFNFVASPLTGSKTFQVTNGVFRFPFAKK